MEAVPSLSNKTCSIDDLPPGILSEVASHLDFMDIFSLQQVSTKLRKSTEARAVWLTLAKEYSARHLHAYRPEIGPFDTLNTDQLRAWVRKRLTVDHIWQAHRAPPPHFRTLDVDGAEIMCLKLVPGTRWLLAGCRDGSVCYYDLDFEDAKRVPLTPPSSVVEGIFETVSALEVHVDKGTLRLEFKLVVHRINLKHGFPTADSIGKFHIWQVKLEDDGNSLVAKWLHTTYGYAFINALALGSHRVACANSSIVGPSWIEAVRWVHPSATRDTQTRFTTGDAKIDKIHLFDEDKILCISREGVVRLYSLPSGANRVSEQSGVSLSQLDQVPGPKVIWSISLQGGTYERSSPIWFNGTTYRFTVIVGDLIYGLVLPALKDDGDPLVVELSDIPESRVISLVGVFKSYTFHEEDGCGLRIGYSWNDGVSVPTMRYLEEDRGNFASYGQYLAFDEELGRFLYLANGNIVVAEYFPQFSITP